MYSYNNRSTFLHPAGRSIGLAAAVICAATFGCSSSTDSGSDAADARTPDAAQDATPEPDVPVDAPDTSGADTTDTAGEPDAGGDAQADVEPILNAAPPSNLKAALTRTLPTTLSSRCCTGGGGDSACAAAGRTRIRRVDNKTAPDNADAAGGREPVVKVAACHEP